MKNTYSEYSTATSIYAVLANAGKLSALTMAVSAAIVNYAEATTVDLSGFTLDNSSCSDASGCAAYDATDTTVNDSSLALTGDMSVNETSGSGYSGVFVDQTEDSVSTVNLGWEASVSVASDGTDGVDPQIDGIRYTADGSTKATLSTGGNNSIAVTTVGNSGNGVTLLNEGTASSTVDINAPDIDVTSTGVSDVTDTSYGIYHSATDSGATKTLTTYISSSDDSGSGHTANDDVGITVTSEDGTAIGIASLFDSVDGDDSGTTNHYIDIGDMTIDASGANASAILVGNQKGDITLSFGKSDDLTLTATATEAVDEDAENPTYGVVTASNSISGDITVDNSESATINGNGVSGFYLTTADGDVTISNDKSINIAANGNSTSNLYGIYTESDGDDDAITVINSADITLDDSASDSAGIKAYTDGDSSISISSSTGEVYANGDDSYAIDAVAEGSGDVAVNLVNNTSSEKKYQAINGTAVNVETASGDAAVVAEGVAIMGGDSGVNITSASGEASLFTNTDDDEYRDNTYIVATAGTAASVSGTSAVADLGVSGDYSYGTYSTKIKATGGNALDITATDGTAELSAEGETTLESTDDSSVLLSSTDGSTAALEGETTIIAAGDYGINITASDGASTLTMGESTTVTDETATTGLTVTNTAGSGVALSSTDGSTVTLQGGSTTITAAGNYGINITASDGDSALTAEELTVDNTAGTGINVEGTTAAIDLSELASVTAAGDYGINAAASDGGSALTAEELTVDNTAGTGINVEGTTAAIDLSGLASVTAAGDYGINTVASDGESTLTAEELTVDNTAGTGINVEGTTVAIDLSGLASVTAAGDYGINAAASDGESTLTAEELTIDNTAGSGINVQGTTAAIDLSGLTNVAAAGDYGINATASDGESTLTAEELTVDNTAGSGITLSSTDGSTVTLEGETTITAAGDYGINVTASDGDSTLTAEESSEKLKVINTAGSGINVEGTTATIDLSGLTNVTASGDYGINATASDGASIIKAGSSDTLTIDNTPKTEDSGAGNGINADGTTATIDLTGLTDVTVAGDYGINATASDGSATLTTEKITVDNTAGSGITLSSTDGSTVTFGKGAAIDAVGDYGIFVDSDADSALLAEGTLDVTNSAGDGISVSGATATVDLLDSTTISADGDGIVVTADAAAATESVATVTISDKLDASDTVNAITLDSIYSAVTVDEGAKLEGGSNSAISFDYTDAKTETSTSTDSDDSAVASTYADEETNAIANLTNSGTITAENDVIVEYTGDAAYAASIDNTSTGTMIGYLNNVNSAATINVDNSGTWYFQNSDSTDGTVSSDLNGGDFDNSGTLELASDGTSTVSGTLADVGTFTNSGIINLSSDRLDSDGYATSYGNTLTIDGDYVSDGGELILNTLLNDGGDDTQTDQLIITGDATNGGTATDITVNYSADSTWKNTNGNGILLVDVYGDQDDSTFDLSEPVTNGLYEYTLETYDDENGFYLVNVSNDDDDGDDGDGGNGSGGDDDVTNPNAGAVIGGQTAGNSIFSNGHGGNSFGYGNRSKKDGEKSGISRSLWATADSNYTEYSLFNDAFTNRIHSYVVNVGGDLLVSDDEKIVAGPYIGFGDAHVRTTSNITGTKSDLKSYGYNMGAYLLFNPAENEGFYLNSWAYYARFKNTLSMNADSSYKSKYYSNVYSVNADFGYKIPYSNTGDTLWIFKPKAEISYNYYDADTFTDSSYTTYSGNRQSGIQGKLGFRLYSANPSKDDYSAKPYAELNWVYNGAKNKLTLDGVNVSDRVAENAAELKVGLTGKLSRDVSVTAELSGKLGESNYKEAAVGLGIRYDF